MEKQSFLSPSKLKAALIYIFFLLVGSILLSALMGMIVANIRGVNPNLVFKSFFEKTTDKDILTCQTIAQGYSNFIVYLLCALGVGFYLRNYLVEDFNQLKENKKKYIVLIPILAIGFIGFAYLIDYLFSLIVNSSNNQKVIVEILSSSARVPMIIATIILAPIVEELIYRKAIFEGLKGQKIYIRYIFSIIFFALPHMLSGADNFGIWVLQLLPYMILGGMLCFVYQISSYNVYASICAHMLNNLLAVILALI